MKPAFYFVIAMIGSTFISSLEARAGSFDNFAGSWRGNGKVVMKNGSTKSVSCKLKSSVQLNGSRVYQNVTCKSDGKKFGLRIKLNDNGGKIAGDWSANGAIDGGVYGRAKGRNVTLHLSGRRINATLKIATSTCTQKMSMSGKIGKVRKMVVRLKKC